MTETPDTRNQIDTEEIDWRETLRRRLSVVAVLLLALVAVGVFASAPSETMRVLGIVWLIYSAVLIGVLSAPWISGQVKSTIIVISLMIASVTGWIIAGFLAGPAVAGAFSLVAAGLLFGRKTFIVTLLVFTLVLLALTIAVATGTWQGPNPVALDPSDPMNWLRTSLITIFGWGGLGVLVLFVVSAVEENLARRRAALEHLQTETAERRAAEKAQREAEEIANQAQKMEAVGQLAAGIAHDFNNALLVIQGWNEIRGEFDSDDTQREATEVIGQAVAHTAQLSRQLLTFSRKGVRTPRYLYLDKVAEETVKTLQHIVGSSIELSLEAQADKLVHADESQIQQLIFNLVLNARDALKKGSGSIRISVRAASGSECTAFDTEDNEWIILQVEDDGTGIDDSAKELVFEPFYTTKGAGKGTGLGLSTVLGIVQQSGGHIDLQSRPGLTTFSVFLPAADVERIDAPEMPDSTEASKLDLRTLVLEDDPLAQKMIVSLLTRNGSDVRSCDNGDAALSQLRDDPQPFDLLCSDAVFPGASLDNVLEAFEQHSPDAKVLICSGYVRGELAIAKLESGEYGYLAKPFSGSRLISKIRELASTAK